ncbi:MAG: GNAT family N-acetyltransferase [Thermoplasmata archaeon]|nr:GNAT family N-acetyltransferase [Thermoplasmata archaeon]
MPEALEPEPTTAASGEALLELTHAIRAELLRRGEFLPVSWVEEAAEDLRAGRLSGVYLPGTPHPLGVAFLSGRGDRAFGHVHVAAGPGALDAALALSLSLVGGIRAPAIRLDAGFTGLSEEQERALGQQLEKLPGGAQLVRLSLEVRVPTPTAPTGPKVPFGTLLVPVRSVPVDAIVELTRRAFVGTPDEPLLDPSPEGGRRVINEILDGRLGRFLDEASTALVSTDGALLAVILTAEQSARRSIFHGLAVDPAAQRHGFATFLIAWGLRALRALGHETASLWVTELNAPALALYHNVGFQAAGTALLFRYVRPATDVPQPQRSR